MLYHKLILKLKLKLVNQHKIEYLFYKYNHNIHHQKNQLKLVVNQHKIEYPPFFFFFCQKNKNKKHKRLSDQLNYIFKITNTADAKIKREAFKHNSQISP